MECSERCPPNTAIDYASVPPRDTSFNSSIEQVIDCGLNLPQPIDNLVLKFPISESRQYLDGLQVGFRARFQICNADGTVLVQDQLLAPVCGIAGAIISKMSVWAGGCPWKVYNMYAYMYHILNLLHHSKEWFASLGTANGFILDDTTADEDATWISNKGLGLRREWGQKSRIFEVSDRMLCPVWLQERLIPTEHQNWSIQLHLNNSDFVLFKSNETVGDYKLYLQKAELLLTKIQLSDSANQLVEARLAREESLLFPLVDYDIQTYSMYEGLLQHQTPPATLDVYPKRFYIFMVTQKQAVGDIKTNPFIYHNFDMDTIQLDLGGRIFGCQDMELADGAFLAAPAYWNLVYKALGRVNGEFPFDIKTWARMYTVFCFDVTDSRFSAECPMLTTPDENRPIQFL